MTLDDFDATIRELKRARLAEKRAHARQLASTPPPAAAKKGTRPAPRAKKGARAAPQAIEEPLVAGEVPEAVEALESQEMALHAAALGEETQELETPEALDEPARRVVHLRELTVNHGAPSSSGIEATEKMSEDDREPGEEEEEGGEGGGEEGGEEEEEEEEEVEEEEVEEEEVEEEENEDGGEEEGGPQTRSSVDKAASMQPKKRKARPQLVLFSAIEKYKRCGRRPVLHVYDARNDVVSLSSRLVKRAAWVENVPRQLLSKEFSLNKAVCALRDAIEGVSRGTCGVNKNVALCINKVGKPKLLKEALEARTIHQFLLQ